MIKNCPGCGENFHAEKDYERQCTECNQADREDSAERKALRIEILKSRIFKRSMELQKKLNVWLNYYGDTDTLWVKIQPKELKMETPYMVELSVYCNGINSERYLQEMLDEIKLCLTL